MDSSGTARRHEVLVVAVIGGMSVLVGIFYIWALQLAARDDPSFPVAPLWAYLVWAVLAALAAGLLWWHRRHPVRVFVLVFALHAAGAALIGNAGLGGVALPLWFAVFALAAYARPRTAAVMTVTAWVLNTFLQVTLVALSGIVVSAQELIVAAFGQGFFFAACFVIGFGMRAQRQRMSDAAERAALAEARTRAEAAEAVARERNHMARELHDLAAHQLMDVLLTTRAALLTTRDPVLAEIEQKSTDALRSIRSVVGALRDDDPDDSAPEPLDEAARRLIDHAARDRELHVDTRIDILSEPPAAVTATMLSILTEVLVNAATHAPESPVAVVLTGDAEELLLEVHNPLAPQPADATPSTTGTGYGLLGAAERAHILSGSLEAGPSPHQEWVVTLTLPIDPSPGETP